MPSVLAVAGVVVGGAAGKPVGYKACNETELKALEGSKVGLVASTGTPVVD